MANGADQIPGGVGAGRAIVVSDIPAHREILDDGTALFVDSEDVEGAARAILSALANPDAARQRAGRARERASRWTIDRMASRFESLYEEIVP